MCWRRCAICIKIEFMLDWFKFMLELIWYSQMGTGIKVEEAKMPNNKTKDEREYRYQSVTSQPEHCGLCGDEAWKLEIAAEKTWMSTTTTVNAYQDATGVDCWGITIVGAVSREALEGRSSDNVFTSAG